MDYQNITLQREGAIPLYRQLADFLKAAIAQGTLKVGERLPPIRTLAQTIGISQVTVTQTYNLLAQEGVIGSHVGRGTFVIAPPAATGQIADATPAPLTPGDQQPSSALQLQSLQAHLPPVPRRQWQVFAEQLFQHAYQAETPISLADAVPDPSVFPLRRWQQSMKLGAKSLMQGTPTEIDGEQFQYGPVLGDPVLRTYLAQAMERYGFHPEPDEILLTSGTQQSLDLIARTLLTPGDTLILEEMTYLAALTLFEQQQVVWHTVPIDQEGMQVGRLAQRLDGPHPRPRLLYTIPLGQSPTGACLSERRRQELARLAEQQNLLIVEDLAFNELYLSETPPPPAIQHFSPARRVLSLISFNKTIFPAVRMGCIIAARPILELLAQTKQQVDRAASLPLARALWRHMDDPDYARELEGYRQHYRERRNWLLDLLEQRMRPRGCQWTIPQAGFSLILTLPPTIDASRVAQAAAQHGAFVMPGQYFAPMPGLLRNNTIRLTYGNLSLDLLEEAVRRLDQALEDIEHQPAERPGHSYDLVPHA